MQCHSRAAAATAAARIIIIYDNITLELFKDYMFLFLCICLLATRIGTYSLICVLIKCTCGDIPHNLITVIRAFVFITY